MHCELVVPGLLSALPAARLPALELLLARGRRDSAHSQSLEHWLHGAFGGGEAPAAAGALTLLASNVEPAEAGCARADPVHLELMRERLVLVPGAALDIERAEAQALCDALNAHFGARLELHAFDPARWAAKCGEVQAIEAPSPLELAGREIGPGLPAGADAPRAHQLLNESQMVLHAHPVNEAREARGAPTLNSLWLWGAGALPALPASSWHSLAANDPVALGLARRAGLRHRPLPAAAAAFLDRAPEDGRHLIVLDALRVPLALSQADACAERLAALERDWFAPLLAALRAQRIGMLTLHVPDAARSVACETIRGDLRRFWKRPRALEAYR
jgi:hypothetical protein